MATSWSMGPSSIVFGGTEPYRETTAGSAFAPPGHDALRDVRTAARAVRDGVIQGGPPHTTPGVSNPDFITTAAHSYNHKGYQAREPFGPPEGSLFAGGAGSYESLARSSFANGVHTGARPAQPFLPKAVSRNG